MAAARASKRTSASRRSRSASAPAPVSWWMAIWKWKLPAFVPDASPQGVGDVIATGVVGIGVSRGILVAEDMESACLYLRAAIDSALARRDGTEVE